MPGSSRLSVVVPAYNEEESLPLLVDEIEMVFPGGVEILLVDDGSTDSTWSVIRGLASAGRVKGLRLGSNQGKAAALSAGFAEAEGSFVATLDADLQDDPSEIPVMIEKMEAEGLDLVSGWKKVRRDPLGKRLPSKLYNLVVRLTTGIRLHDFNCGLKVYRRKVTDRLELYGEMHRYTPVLAVHSGFTVGELPVHHRPREHGRSKYGLSRFWRGYADLLTVLFLRRYSARPLHFFGGIGTVMSLAGFGVNVYLTVLWLGGESIGRRPLLLLGVFLMLVGFQFISLGLLGEMLLRLSRGRKFTVTERAPREGRE
jgi:glycosyltransferase involved in cell wall biosynthesis